MKPLPYQIRLINRVLLIGFILFLLSRLISSFIGPEIKGSCLDSKDYEFLPSERDLPLVPQVQLALTGKLPKEEPIDSTHILKQKDVFLAQKMDHLLRIYKPEHARFLVVDANKNEILAWGQRSEGTVQSSPPFLSQSTFPAASLFKTVTLTAAFESKTYSLDSAIPFIDRA